MCSAMANAASNMVTASGEAGRALGQCFATQALSTTGSPGQPCGQRFLSWVKVWHSRPCKSNDDELADVMPQRPSWLQSLPARKALLMFNCNSKASNTGTSNGEVPAIIWLACSLEIFKHTTSPAA